MKHSAGIVLALVVWAIFLPFSAFAKPIVQVSDGLQHLSVANQSVLIEGGGSSMGAAAALKASGWRAASQTDLELGVHHAPIWVRFSIDNGSTRPVRALLELANPRLEHVTFYRVDGAQITTLADAGISQPFNERPFDYRTPVLPLEIGSAEHVELLIRVQSRTFIFLPLTLHSIEAWQTKLVDEYIFFGALFASLLLFVAFNAVLFVLMRDRSALYYSLFVLTGTLYALLQQGFGYQFLWSNWAEFNLLMSNTVIATHYIFAGPAARAILQTRELAPRADKAFELITVLAIFWAAVTLLVEYRTAQMVVMWGITATLIPLGVYGAVIAFRHKLPGWWIVATTIVLILVAYVALMLDVQGVVPSSLFTRHSSLVSNTLQAFLISSMIVIRVLAIQREKERELQQRLAESEKLVAFHKSTQAFVPQQLLELLGKDNLSQARLGDTHLDQMACLFIDMRSFSTISQRMSPAENSLFVNRFYGRLGPVIRKHEGVVCRYIGDAMLCVFPAGVEGAVSAALEIAAEIGELREELPQLAQEGPPIGMGVHSGPVALSVVGEAERMEISAYGDVVNVAARIQQLAAAEGQLLLISGEAAHSLGGGWAHRIQEFGQRALKGRQGELRVLTVK